MGKGQEVGFKVNSSKEQERKKGMRPKLVQIIFMRVLFLSHSPTLCLSLFLSIYTHTHTHTHTYIYIYIYKISKVGDRSRGRPKGFLFNSYYTEVYGRMLLPSLYCSTLPSIRNLYCWVLSKEVSSTIFKVFGMTRPGIEHRSLGPLANTLPTRPMGR